ncbi:MAG: hypothetical protein ABIQ90_03965 [Polaromonas sp.]
MEKIVVNQYIRVGACMQKTSLSLALAMAFQITETRSELNLKQTGITLRDRLFGDCKSNASKRRLGVCHRQRQRQRLQKGPLSGRGHLPQQVTKTRRHIRC